MSWNEYEKMVLDKLDGLEKGLADLRVDVVALRVAVAGDVSALKVKAGLWGAGFGTLGSILVVLSTLLLRLWR